MNNVEFLSLFLILSWVIGLVVATVITAFDMWGWFDWYEYHRRPWMPGACKFCAGFWFSFLLLTILVLRFEIRVWEVIFIPFASAAIAKWVNR